MRVTAPSMPDTCATDGHERSRPSGNGLKTPPSAGVAARSLAGALRLRLPVRAPRRLLPYRAWPLTWGKAEANVWRGSGPIL
jgi:hypothetical protein